MRFVKGFGQFWVDFLIGDDAKIAVSVLSVLAALAVLVDADVVSSTVVAVLGGGMLVIGFATSLVIDVRGSRR
jgi:hypothetical protein